MNSTNIHTERNSLSKLYYPVCSWLKQLSKFMFEVWLSVIYAVRLNVKVSSSIAHHIFLMNWKLLFQKSIGIFQREFMENLPPQLVYKLTSWGNISFLKLWIVEWRTQKGRERDIKWEETTSRAPRSLQGCIRSQANLVQHHHSHPSSDLGKEEET